MLLSENWLKEWVDPKLSTQALADTLTMAGLEVGGIEPQSAQFSNVVVGHVHSVEPHPDSNRLKVCEVYVSDSQSHKVVCGAENVAPGMNVALALIDAKLPNGMVIKESTIRGVTSKGMICSMAELGLSEKSEGIMPLDDSAERGKKLEDHLQLPDQQLDIELTPNRGDCLSINGVARELAALTSATMNPVEIPPIPASNNQEISIDVKAWDGCPRYVGRIISDIDINAKTPDWMKEKLRRCGVRPISAIVDITNYVMLELGQPMHAFDLENVHKGIIVRYADNGEKLTLLDESEINLATDDLLICDHNGPVALAGIMGGLGSGIADNTKTVLLESAYFTQSKIIGKARRLGMQTDASYRYERGVDPCLQEIAIQRATKLILDICRGQPGVVVDCSNAKYLPVKAPIDLRFSQLNKIIGIEIDTTDAANYLSMLGCKVEDLKSSLQATPPSFRFDLEKEHDLIEEVARLYGYNRVPENPPTVTATNSSPSESKLAISRLRNLMIDRGYNEAITYSFVDPNVQGYFHKDHSPITLTNPIADNLSQMRLSLLPGLLKALENNYNRQHRQIKLFEIGNTYKLHKKQRVETLTLGAILTGMRMPEQWAAETSTIDFYDAKGDLQSVSSFAGLSEKLVYKVEHRDGFHPGQCAGIYIDKTNIGFIGQLLPSYLSNLDIDSSVFYFQINADVITHTPIPSYNSTSRYPSIRRDLSIIVDQEVRADEILSVILNSAGKELVDLKLFDVYTGKPIDSTKKSVSLGLTFQALERTLTEMEMDEACQRVMDKLQNKLNAKLRQ